MVQPYCSAINQEQLHNSSWQAGSQGTCNTLSVMFSNYGAHDSLLVKYNAKARVTLIEGSLGICRESSAGTMSIVLVLTDTIKRTSPHIT